MNADDHAERITRRELLTGLAGAALAGVSGCDGGAPATADPTGPQRRDDPKDRESERAMTTDPILNVRPLGFQWETVDPFLFCVHHDDAYPQGNEQLGPATSLAGRDIGQDFAGVDGWRMYHGDVVPGFPQHPHRGFETVTVVRKGLIDHSDSLGATARFGRGDTQWLTAGAGIVHAEMFPLVEREAKNPLELFQIWLNLPKASKFAAPYFSMLWRETTPIRTEKDAEGRSVEVTVIAGDLADTKAPAPPPDSWAARVDSDVAIWSITLAPGARWTLPAAQVGTNRTLYFYRGAGLSVAGRKVSPRSGVRLRAAVAWSQADAEQPALPGVYDMVETWSAGGSVEFSSLAFGASWLDSSNGLAGPGGDYSALSGGLRMTFGKVDAGLEWVDAEDKGIGTESETIGLSLGRNFGDTVRIVGGWQRHDTRFTGNPLPLAPALREQTDGIVIEITLSS